MKNKSEPLNENKLKSHQTLIGQFLEFLIKVDQILHLQYVN